MFNNTKYLARVYRSKRVTQDELVKLIVERNTMMTGEDIKAVLGLLWQVITSQLLRGNHISIDLFYERISIKGTFKSFESEFDRVKHRVVPCLSPSSELMKALGLAQVEKIRDIKPAPVIDNNLDYRTGTQNLSVFSGFRAEVKC